MPPRLLGSGAAAAQTAVLYGLLDASAAASSRSAASYRCSSTAATCQRSFLGFRGSEDLGGGLRACFALESYLRVDSRRGRRAPATTRSGAATPTSACQGAFGTTVLGRDADAAVAGDRLFNPFGESFGFSPSIRQYFGGAVLGDTRWNNSIAYTNNPQATTAARHLRRPTPTRTTPSGSNGHNLGLSVAYISGPFAATAVGERVRNSAQPLPAGFDHQSVAASSARPTTSSSSASTARPAGSRPGDRDSQTDLYQLGAAVPFGPASSSLAYGTPAPTTPSTATTDQTFSLGYDYFLSKSTDLYVVAMNEQAELVSSGNSVAGGVRSRF